MHAEHGHAAAKARPTHGNVTGMAAIMLWSTLALLTTWSNRVPALQLLAGAFLTAGLIGLLVPLPHVRSWSGYAAALRQPWPAFALTTTALFGYHVLYVLALRTAPPLEASLINYLWPVLIVLFSAWLYRQPISPSLYIAALLGLFGAVVLVTRLQAIRLDPAYVPGYLAALVAACTWALYSVLNRRFPSVPSTAMALPCLCVGMLSALAHGLFETTVVPTRGEWLVVIAIGLGPAGAAFWLWDHGTKHGNLAVLGTLAYAAPVLTTLWLLLAGQTQPHWTQALACAAIVASGLLAMRASRQKTPAPTSTLRTMSP